MVILLTTLPSLLGELGFPSECVPLVLTVCECSAQDWPLLCWTWGLFCSWLPEALLTGSSIPRTESGEAGVGMFHLNHVRSLQILT